MIITSIKKHKNRITTAIKKNPSNCRILKIIKKNYNWKILKIIKKT